MPAPITRLPASGRHYCTSSAHKKTPGASRGFSVTASGSDRLGHVLVLLDLVEVHLAELGLASRALRRRIGLTTRADWHPTRPQQAFLQTFREVCAERSNDGPDAWPFRYR